jgi:protein-disulfide isomerase
MPGFGNHAESRLFCAAASIDEGPLHAGHRLSSSTHRFRHRRGARQGSTSNHLGTDTMLIGLFSSVLFGSLLIALPGFAQTTGSTKPHAIAVVGGQNLYEDDLLPLVQAPLREVRQQEYEIKSEALETLIGQRLLEEAAKKQGLSTEKLLEREVHAKVGEPTESEVEAYYLARKDELDYSFGEIKTQLQQALKDAKLQQVRNGYLKRLREETQVAVLLDPPRSNVGFDPARVRGHAGAPVTIVEFSDFQCPYCGKAESTVKEVLGKYTDTVRFAYRDFPLHSHPHAQGAAEASRCAADQGKYWEYHDLLFAHQDKLDPAGLAEQARILKLDEKKFDECLKSGKYQAAVEKDLQDGTQAGVSGTPAFFINGVFLNGAQPASAFEKIIESELAAQKSQERGKPRLSRVSAK